jgi:hypothetical protein
VQEANGIAASLLFFEQVFRTWRAHWCRFSGNLQCKKEEAKKISCRSKESWTHVDPSLSLTLLTYSRSRGKSKPLREAGVLHVRANTGTVKKILCYRYDMRVGNTKQILLLSLRTIRDANIDILHHMDQSLDGISSPLLFLQDKDARTNKKEGVTGKAQAFEKFLRQQRRKRDRGNACAVFLASNTTAAKEHVDAGPQNCDERQLHCLLDTDDENGYALNSQLPCEA